MDDIQEMLVKLGRAGKISSCPRRVQYFILGREMSLVCINLYGVMSDKNRSTVTLRSQRFNGFATQAMSTV